MESVLARFVSIVGPPTRSGFWRDLWARTALTGLVLMVGVFGAYEIVERTWLAEASLVTLHRLHILRGMSSSLLLASWAFLSIRRARLEVDRKLEGDVRALEGEVRERTLALEEARARHQEKMASLGLLAAGIAHDLGNPLASLSSELELLEGEDDLARVRESLDVLRSHVGRINRTLREMVEFARRRREAVADVSIAAAFDDSTRLVRHDPRLRKISLVRAIEADLPPIRMVEDHLVMVLVNLIINAADAMPEGGTITLAARGAADHLEISVRDTGVGMTAEVLAQAMNPLFTTKGDRKGSGLGLSVSRSVIKEMGGDIEIASAPGEGAEVRITLPLQAAEAEHG